MNEIPEKKIALVLGGGSARGLAHIGVLNVLQQAGITVDFIVGTSIGALIGAIYALGIPLEKTRERALKIKWWHLTDFVVSKTGLLGGAYLEKIIADSVENKGFEDLKIPLFVVTTDIETGEKVILNSGNLVEVIKASCSLPGIFVPVKINERLLVDGGLRESVPSRIARQMGASFVIASDVGFCVKKGKVTNIFQMIFQSIQIAGSELNSFQSKLADMLIKIDLPDDIDQMAFDKADFIIEKGEESARMALPLLINAMKQEGLIEEGSV